MALVSHDTGEVQFKIVYCGPPEGGKTSNLRYIHQRLDSRWRGDMISVATENDRTLSFDFLPILSSEIAGYRTRFQLYTVPGQQVLRGTRVAVLAGVDAVVFVADSTPDRIESNLRSFCDLEDCLQANGIAPGSIPVVFQFNKRDLRDAIPPELLDEALGIRAPTFLACATSGYQVFRTLDYATQLILQGFHASDVAKGSVVSDNGNTRERPARTASCDA